MNLLWECCLFVFYSLLIVAISKYILVPVLRKLAESMNLKAKTVGNLAGVATSVPEFLSVSFAAVTGLIGTSVFNILSSNVINLVQYSVSLGINHNFKILRNKALIIDIVMVVITILIPIIFVITNFETNIFVAFYVFPWLLAFITRNKLRIQKRKLSFKAHKGTLYLNFFFIGVLKEQS